MFRKLITNLPYNPSLIGQLSLYQGRLKRDISLRSFGLLLLILTLAVQALAVASPPERSLHISANDIIPGGVQDRSDIQRAWDEPSNNVASIYTSLGITQNDISSLTLDPNTTIDTSEADYWTTGRSPVQGSETHTSGGPLIPIQFTDRGDTFYQYPLTLYGQQSLPAFAGTAQSTGTSFWIIASSGGVTTIDPIPTADPATNPQLDTRVSLDSKPDHFSPGDTVTYNILYRNAAENTVAQDAAIELQFDTKLFNIPNTETAEYTITNGFFHSKRGAVGYTSNYTAIPLTITLKDQINSGTNICTQARITASDAAAQLSNNLCVRSLTLCQDTTSSNNPNCTSPKLACSIAAHTIDTRSQAATYDTTVSSSNPTLTAITGYTYDLGDANDENAQTYSSDAYTHSLGHRYSPGVYTAVATVSYRTADQSDSSIDQTVSCATDAYITQGSSAPIGQRLSAINTADDASISTAPIQAATASDTLAYTVHTTNPYDHPIAEYVIHIPVDDMLDYTVITTDSLAQSDGVYIAETNTVDWAPTTLRANTTLSHTLTFNVNDPVISTNQPSLIAPSFDCRVSSVYGNTLTKNIECPAIKDLESAPNISAVSSLLLTAAATVSAGFFYVRSRVLASQVARIKSDHTIGAGT